MPRLRRGLALVALVCVVAACSPESARDERERERRRPRAERSYRAPEVVGHLRDPELIEVSGIVASRRATNVFWVHNDSEGAAAVYCVRRNGDSCGRVTVSGAEAVDWEDIAADAAGNLYIGDIGDNLRRRDDVVVYRIAEPSPRGEGGESVSEPAVPIVLRYPKGRAYDAEALLVHPRSNDLYIVTKGSPARVFRGPSGGGALRPIARVELPGFLSLVTGGDIAPDGRHVLLGTYGSAFELSLPSKGSFDAVWRRRPVELTLPPAEQREAIAYSRDDGAIVTTSEGRRASLIERRMRG